MASIRDVLVQVTDLSKKQATQIVQALDEYETPEKLVYEIIGQLNSGQDLQTVLADITNGNFGWAAASFEKMRQNRRVKDKMIATPPEVREGEMACPKCKQKKTVVVEMQTRSADEGYTYFIHCFNPKCKAITR